MTRWSQNLEQDYILEYFGNHIGTFCSIGENNGITFSNVRALAELNWKGVCVECDPRAYSELHLLYKNNSNIYTYNYAITGHNGKAILNKASSLLKNGDVGLVSTFHASEMERFKSVVTYEPEEVKCFKWKTALNRWKIRTFDLISIDIEFDEMNVLPDIDLSETSLICLEHNGNVDRKKSYLECTSKYGLDRIIYESGENIVIVR